MILKPANVALITQAVNTKFTQAYLANIPSWMTRVATIVPSMTAKEIYPWLAAHPQFRKWEGDRQSKSVATYSYELANESYELTIDVERQLIRDDQYGIWLNTIVPQIGANAARKKALLVRDAMLAGNNFTCYDGQNFFDASHPVNKFPGSGVSGTQKNYWTSKALTPNNYAEVRAGMMTLKDESGEVMGITPNLLVVPPQLEQMGRQILNADFVAGQTFAGETQVGGHTNTLKGSAELLVINELTSAATTWFLLDTTKGILPFLWQNREELEMVALTNPTDEPVFRRKKLVWGAEIQGAAGYSLWPLAAMAVA